MLDAARGPGGAGKGVVISVLVGLGQRDLAVAGNVAAAAQRIYKMKGEDRIAVYVELLGVFIDGT
jgi:Fe-S cluster assembly ATPase SufC